MRTLLLFAACTPIAVIVAAAFIAEGWPYAWSGPLAVYVATAILSLYNRIPGDMAALVIGPLGGRSVQAGPSVWVFPVLQQLRRTYPKTIQRVNVELDAMMDDLMPIKLQGLINYRVNLQSIPALGVVAGWTAERWQTEVKSRFTSLALTYFAYNAPSSPFYACNREKVRADLLTLLEHDVYLQERGVTDMTLRVDEVGPPEAWRTHMFDRARELSLLEVMEQRLTKLMPSLPKNCEDQTRDLARLMVASRAAQSGGQTTLADLVLAGLFSNDKLNQAIIDSLRQQGQSGQGPAVQVPTASSGTRKAGP